MTHTLPVPQKQPDRGVCMAESCQHACHPRLLGPIALAGAASVTAWGESGQIHKLRLLWERNKSLAVPLEVEGAASFLPVQINYTETKGEICRTRNVTKTASPPPSRVRLELWMAQIQMPAAGLRIPLAQLLAPLDKR